MNVCLFRQVHSLIYSSLVWLCLSSHSQQDGACGATDDRKVRQKKRQRKGKGLKEKLSNGTERENVDILCNITEMWCSSREWRDTPRLLGFYEIIPFFTQHMPT